MFSNCAQATQIRKINVLGLSFSSEDQLDSIKSTKLKVIQIGKKVPYSLIDLMFGDCECFELAVFELYIDTNATNIQRILEKLKKCKSINSIQLQTCLDYPNEDRDPINSIDFSQIVSLCLDAKKTIFEFDIRSITLTNFTRSNVNALLLGTKNYPTFKMSIMYRDSAMKRVIDEMKSEMIGNEDAFKRIRFTYLRA